MFSYLNNNAKHISPPYPKLMEGINSGCVCLFERPGQGTVVFQGTTGSPLGFVYTDADMNNWIDYPGQVVLSNEEVEK